MLYKRQSRQMLLPVGRSTPDFDLPLPMAGLMHAWPGQPTTVVSNEKRISTKRQRSGVIRRTRAWVASNTKGQLAQIAARMRTQEIDSDSELEIGGVHF
jgi:hypothetical protein